MFLNKADQTVKLPSGKRISLMQVTPGDVLMGQSRGNKVIQVKKTTRHFPLYEINQSVVASADQLFRNADGFWAAIDPKAAEVTNPLVKDIVPLTSGMDLITLAFGASDGYTYVERIEPLTTDAIYVCLELELDGDHTFFLNDFLVHNKGGSGSSGGGTTISTYQPPAYLEPYLTDIANQAQTAYQAVPQGGFSGDLVAKPTAAQLQAISGTQALAANPNITGFGGNTAAVANQTANKVLSGAYTAPLNNTFSPVNLATTDAVNAYLDPVAQKLQNELIPGLKSQAIQQGAYGGSRYYNTAAQTVNDNFTKEASNIAAQLGYGEAVRGQDQSYKAWETNQNLAPELFKTEQAAGLALPTINQGAAADYLLPQNLLQQAGTAQQLNQQDLLDEAYSQYMLSTQAPFVGLDQYSSVINGAPSGGTTTTTGTPRNSSGGAGGALGGGLAAYGLSSMAPFAALGGPIGIGAGAILGGLLGAF